MAKVNLWDFNKPFFVCMCPRLSPFQIFHVTFSFFTFCSPSKAKNRGGQQIRGQVPENESLVQDSNQTAGGGAEEKPGEMTT